MAILLCVRVDWDRTALPLPASLRYHHLHIDPEPGYPFGRKGLQLASAWRHLAAPHFDGMLIIDGDVMIDPADHAAMMAAIDAEPGQVHTAPVRIWPASTKRPGWVWSHWADQASQDIDRAGVRWFSFCYTYLPRPLLSRCLADGMAGWQYPGVDMEVSKRAVAAGIPVNIVPGCWPKHLHW
jgi:hypothetical protein